MSFVKADSRNLPKVENVMILEYIVTNNKHNLAEIRGVKILLSSRDSYLQSALGYVQVKRTGNECTVQAKVVPEHRVATKMYTVFCTIDEQNNVIKDAVCEDCAASQGGCKHSMLLLFWLEKKSSEPSPTATQCYWNKPSLSSIRGQVVLTKDIFPRCKRPQLKPRDSEVLEAFRKESLKRNVNDSLIMLMSSNRINESKNIFDMILDFTSKTQNHDFFEFMKFLDANITPEIKKDIFMNTKGQSQNKYWHNIRQGRLTASKLHEAAHCQTDGALVEQIFGGYKVPETVAIQRGKTLEQSVLNEVCKKIKMKIEPAGFMMVNGILGASPDGIGDDFVVEVKCPASNKTLKTYINQNSIQPKHKTQIQCQMHALGKKKGIFCVANPNFETSKTVNIIWEEYDKNYIENIIGKAEKFWSTFIYPKLILSSK